MQERIVELTSKSELVSFTVGIKSHHNFTDDNADAPDDLLSDFSGVFIFYQNNLARYESASFYPTEDEDVALSIYNNVLDILDTDLDNAAELTQAFIALDLTSSNGWHTYD